MRSYRDVSLMVLLLAGGASCVLDRSAGDLQPAEPSAGGGGEGGSEPPVDCVTSDECEPASTLCLQPACVNGSCSYDPLSAGSACEDAGLCDGAGTCKRDLGQPCNGDDDACFEGFCVDGLCCDSLCDQDCSSCAVTGLEGSCQPEASGTTSPDCNGGLCDGLGHCAEGALTWGKAFGGSLAYAEGRAIAPDGTGNTYLLVEIDDDMDFGGATLSPAVGSDDVALVKLDAMGDEIWHVHLQSTSWAYAEDLAPTPDGGTVAVGRFYDGLTVEMASLVSDGSADSWALRLDAAGQPLWTYHVGGTGFSGAYEVAIHDDGDVLMGGSFESDVDFGSDLVTSTGATEAFVVRLDAMGTPQWRRVLGGTGEQFLRGLAFDGEDILVAGSFTETMTLASTHSATDFDIYLARLDGSGTPQGSWSYGGAGDHYVGDLAVCPDGSVVMVGYYTGTLDFGSGALPYTSDVDAFVVKIDPAGAPVWTKSFNGPDAVRALSVAVDPAGNVIVGGGFETSTSFDGEMVSSSNQFDPDAYLVKLGPDGSLFWHQTYGSTFDDETIGVAVDAEGNVYATGYFDEAVVFGQTVLSEGFTDVFAVKLGP